MKITQTGLEGCVVIEPMVFSDDRGYFYESFNEKTFNELTNNGIRFVQDNQSFSKYGVIRGLHGQSGAFAQSKLVRVIMGKVLDVVVDVRPDSATFGQHFAIELSAENKKQLFIPKGFLHGFSVLEDNTIFCYKCDAYYNKASEIGVLYNDVTLNIDWQIPANHIVVNAKDLLLPDFETFKTSL